MSAKTRNKKVNWKDILNPYHTIIHLALMISNDKYSIPLRTLQTGWLHLVSVNGMCLWGNETSILVQAWKQTSSQAEAMVRYKVSNSREVRHVTSCIISNLLNTQCFGVWNMNRYHFQLIDLLKFGEVWSFMSMLVVALPSLWLHAKLRRKSA